jgi:excisionase family DNA binding protein
MTVADAAEFLSVSRRQVYLLLERGELPAVRVGARLRLIPSELAAYLEQHREAAP